MENKVYYLGNELYHYGILGMKWGHRKNREEIQKAKANYKAQTKKDKNKLRDLSYELGKTQGLFVSDNPRVAVRDSKRYDLAKKKYDQVSDRAFLNKIHGKASIKSAKAGDNSEKRIKAEQKYYSKQMSKYGKIGSVTDVESGHKASKLYYDISARKGKAYANKVVEMSHKRVNRRAAVAGAMFVASLGLQVAMLDR